MQDTANRPPAPCRRDRLRRRALLAMPLAFGGALLCLTQEALAQPLAPAQDGAQRQERDYAIPAGPLGVALNRFAAQAGIFVSGAGELGEGRHSPGLRGRHGVEEGLERLLEGTGLGAVRQGDGSFRLEPRADSAAVTLSTLQVEADWLGEAALEPVAGFVARRSASTKSAAPLLETPRTVNVVTRDQMDAQGVRNLDQALRYTPGVMTEGNGVETRSDNLLLRGFEPTAYRDGLRDSWHKVETFGLERVEVLKGPASVLYGQGRPGGLLNMVSKRPLEERRRELQLETGSFDHRQVAGDVTGPLGGSGRLFYRLVGLAKDSGTQVDHVDDSRVYLAPSLTWLASDDTRLTLMARYQRDDAGMTFSALPVAGTLEPSPWGRIPRNRFTGDPGYDAFDATQYALGYELTHWLGDDWSLRQNLAYSETDSEFRALFGDGFTSLLPDMRTYQRDVVRQTDYGRGLSVDNRLEGRFASGDLRHEVTLGLDGKRMTSGYAYHGIYYGTPDEVDSIDLFDPVYGVEVPEPPLMSDSRTRLTQFGLYAQDQMSLGRWRFNLAGRWDRASTDYRFANHVYDTRSLSDHTDSAFSGQLGVLYRFDSGIAPYLSYATSFEPVNGGDFAGEAFEPSEGSQWEAGVKYQPHGHDALITLSAFDLEQRNVLTPDPEHSGFQTQTGEVRVRGAELEAKAHLGAGFGLIGSYTYQDTEVTRSNRPGEEGGRLNGVPRHQSALWLDHAVPGGRLAGLSAGAGVRYVGALYGENAGQYRIPSYTLVDAALRYDFAAAWPGLAGLSLAVNVSNLTDESYVRTCGARFACQYGAERTVIATLGYRW